MKHYVRIIDDNGLFVEDAFVDELSANTIAVECPSGLFHPKWDGEKWIEGGTPPEPSPIAPSLEQRVILLGSSSLSGC